MSSTMITVGELRAKLAEYPDDMLVGVISPIPRLEARDEGNIEGIGEFEVVKAHEVRSGWCYPPGRWHGDEDCQHTILVLSDVGVQWCEDLWEEYSD